MKLTGIISSTHIPWASYPSFFETQLMNRNENISLGMKVKTLKRLKRSEPPFSSRFLEETGAKPSELVSPGKQRNRDMNVTLNAKLWCWPQTLKKCSQIIHFTSQFVPFSSFLFFSFLSLLSTLHF